MASQLVELEEKGGVGAVLCCILQLPVRRALIEALLRDAVRAAATAAAQRGGCSEVLTSHERLCREAGAVLQLGRPAAAAEAQRALRARGQGELARRVERENRARRGLAHPDPDLHVEVTAALVGSCSAEMCFVTAPESASEVIFQDERSEVASVTEASSSGKPATEVVDEQVGKSLNCGVQEDSTNRPKVVEPQYDEHVKERQYNGKTSCSEDDYSEVGNNEGDDKVSFDEVLEEASGDFIKYACTQLGLSEAGGRKKMIKRIRAHNARKPVDAQAIVDSWEGQLEVMNPAGLAACENR